MYRLRILQYSSLYNFICRNIYKMLGIIIAVVILIVIVGGYLLYRKHEADVAAEANETTWEKIKKWIPIFNL